MLGGTDIKDDGKFSKQSKMQKALDLEAENLGRNHQNPHKRRSRRVCKRQTGEATEVHGSATLAYTAEEAAQRAPASHKTEDEELTHTWSSDLYVHAWQMHLCEHMYA